MIPDREYVFASSFIKAAEGKGTPAERLSRFREASDRDSLRSSAAEAFKVSAENVYDEAINSAVELVKSALPDFSAVVPLLYKYDCANIKTAVKCKIRGISPEGLLFSCGTLPASAVVNAAESSDFSKIPGELGAAAAEALKTYQKTGEVRSIDLILDRACFADMKKAAEESGCELTGRIVRTRADGTNLLTAMRISAEGLSPDTAASLFERAFVPGGNMPLSSFCSVENGVEDAEKISARAAGDTASVIKTAAKCPDADAAAKVIDEEIISLCMKYRFKPFGPEVAVSLIVVREAEITNCRIIEAAIGTENREDTVRERLRAAYV